jgi:hypothetical protein
MLSAGIVSLAGSGCPSLANTPRRGAGSGVVDGAVVAEEESVPDVEGAVGVVSLVAEAVAAPEEPDRVDPVTSGTGSAPLSTTQPDVKTQDVAAAATSVRSRGIFAPRTTIVVNCRSLTPQACAASVLAGELSRLAGMVSPSSVGQPMDQAERQQPYQSGYPQRIVPHRLSRLGVRHRQRLETTFAGISGGSPLS